MSIVEIKIKAKKLKKGDSIPELEKKSQKVVEVYNGDTIRWKYQNNSELSILPDAPFTDDPSQTHLKGAGKAETTVNGATSAENRVISYNIKTSDTDTELDPVIVIKEPNPFPFIIKNPLLTVVISVIAGFIVGLFL